MSGAYRTETALMPTSFTQSRLGLTTGQFLFLVIIGAVLWFLAAALLRTIGPTGAFEGTRRFTVYAITIPGTLPFIWMTKTLVKLPANRIGIGYSVATATALLLDGVAVAWFPELYGTDPVQVTNSAAAILWGAGVGMVLAFAINRQPTKSV